MPLTLYTKKCIQVYQVNISIYFFKTLIMKIILTVYDEPKTQTTKNNINKITKEKHKKSGWHSVILGIF